jgi:hypothetical protein
MSAETPDRPHRDRFGCLPVFWLPLIARLHDFKVGAALMGRANAHGLAHASLTELSRDAGLLVRDVRRAIKRLEDGGFVARVKVGRGRTPSTYAMWITKTASVRPPAQPKGCSARSDAQSKALDDLERTLQMIQRAV